MEENSNTTRETTSWRSKPLPTWSTQATREQHGAKPFCKPWNPSFLGTNGWHSSRRTMSRKSAAENWDSGYLGVEKCAEIREDPRFLSVDYRIAKRPSQNRTTKAYAGVHWDKKIEHEKSSIRCKVEHPFLIVKHLFQAGRTRYRGLKKNLLRYYLLFTSANLVMCLRAGRQRGFCMTMG